MRTLLAGISAAALMLGITPVLAADLMSANAGTVEAPAPEAFNGFYAGVNLGYVNQRGQLNDIGPNYSNNSGWQDVNSVNGFLLGGQIGYDFRLGSDFVLGVSADVASVMAPTSFCTDASCISANPPGSLGYEITGLGSLTARAGVVVGDTTLLYALAGPSVASVRTHHWDSSEGDGTTRLFSGFTVGIGAETMVTDNVSVGIEGRYYKFAGQTWTDHFDEDFGAAPEAFTAKLTANFHF
jgi:outer membrane immunogenic protein